MSARDRNPRITSAKEAIGTIESGDTVVLGTGCSEPQTLVEELVRQRERLGDVRLLTLLPAGKCEYARAGMERHFRVQTFMSRNGLYDAMKAGRAHYIPCHVSEIPRLFEEGYIRVDVALIQVSPPDDRGYCSFGISVDCLKAAAETARVVIAEVNERMPRARGDCYINVSDIDFIVKTSRPLLTVEATRQLGEVETTIGRIVADLIPDGATVQVGIGAIPDAVVHSLCSKRGLRVHTGIITDSIVDLALSGALAAPEPQRAPVVAMIAMGSQTLYDFIHENPAIEMHPCTYTNNPSVLSRLPGLVAVNSALQIDLMGQVNAESVGGVQLSGVGGQMDFVRAASLSRAGKSIIALPSTANRGATSRIVPTLGHGAVVTTPRSDVHYVVTEYGAADLRGKSLKERARALAAIAHPDFREELLAKR